jgi:hypothetical protein
MLPPLIQMGLLHSKVKKSEGLLIIVEHTGAKRKLIKSDSTFHSSSWCLTVIIVIRYLRISFTRKEKLIGTQTRCHKINFTSL